MCTFFPQRHTNEEEGEAIQLTFSDFHPMMQQKGEM